MIVGSTLTAFGLIGAMSRWLSRRRILRGAKASDTAAVIAMSPILLVRSILSTALGLVVGGLVPYGIWAFVSYSREGASCGHGLPMSSHPPVLIARTIG